MSKPVKIIVWLLGIFIGLPVLLAVSFICYLSFTAFSPVLKSKMKIDGNGSPFDQSKREFTFFTWNIGYAGLGREMDFFYDGGKLSRPSKAQFREYFQGIQKGIKASEGTDFIFLQELDVFSKRAWYQNEYMGVSALLTKYFHVFALNYDCRFVPLPLSDPMGRVKGGLATFSSVQPDAATVQYYESNFPWPTQLVMLKRCYMLFRFRLDNGKELIIVNLHNSAYDSTGALRQRELFILDSVLTSEYRQGNYVIAGGDWNNNPNGFNIEAIHQGDRATTIDPPIPDKFFKDWSFVYDSLTPSNRFTDIPYEKGVTRTTIIDFFVVSPNVETKNIRTVPMGFKYSDHEPVVMGVRLR
ncbi:MAG: endonuclease/exonuclease/phosphatase family protein [Bacteroidota bacterium]